MPSTFLGLNTSYTGLIAANASLNTTANNIANIETPGYTRQQVNQTAAEAMRAYAGYGCVGAGVDTLGAERIRDIYYDQKYWNNNSKLGEQEKKLYYALLVDNYLRDQRGTNAVEGFQTIFDAYDNAMSSLATNTASPDHAREFIGSANKLCEYFNLLYNNFQKMQIDVNDEIGIKVNEINGIAQEIASLNKQINTVEVNGNTMANELRDKRDLLVDQLSAVIDVECEERPIYTTSGRESGVSDYIVKIAGGQVLVDGKDYRQLECVPRTSWQKVDQNEAYRLYDICWTDSGQEMNVQATVVRGELKGLIEMRDGNNDEAFHGKITSVDTINNSVTVRVTDDYLKNIAKSTLPLTDGRIVLGGEKFYYKDFEVTLDDNGECYYTFNLSDDRSRNPVPISKDKIGYNAKVGEQMDYQGISYYLAQMNEWVRDYAAAFNSIYGGEDTRDFDEKDRTGAIFFTGDNKVTGDQYALETKGDYSSLYAWYASQGQKEKDGGLIRATYKSSEDGYYALTGGNFAVENSVENDPRTFATHTVEWDGESKYDSVSELLDLSTNLDKMRFRGCDARSFLTCLMGDAALNANSASSFSAVYGSIEESIQNSRYSISGVDTDEEAANMIKFKSAYNLASKMISVLNECYERLILETGV